MPRYLQGPEHFTELNRIPLGDGTGRGRERISGPYLNAPRAFVRLSVVPQD